MRNYLILLVIVLFSSTAVLAQPGSPGSPGGPPYTGDTPPPPPGGCECCEEFGGSVDPANPNDPNSEYNQCLSACVANNGNCVPIDSGIVILVLLGASLGIYQVYKNKKRQIVN